MTEWGIFFSAAKVWLIIIGATQGFAFYRRNIVKNYSNVLASRDGKSLL
jgi:hypothetical protein